MPVEQKILYLGLDPARCEHKGEITHLPIIKIVPRPFEGEIQVAFNQLIRASHIIVTSRTAASLFCCYVEKIAHSLHDKIFLSVGQATAALLYERGLSIVHVASQESAEGIVTLLSALSPASHVFYPHSALSRPLIRNYLNDKRISFTEVELYDTVPNRLELPNLDQFDKIIFTSPSTVSAFFTCTTQIPDRKKCISIGPITLKYLENYF